MKDFITKIEEIDIPNDTTSKVEEFIIPKSKINIEPFSNDEKEYIKYLVDKYSKKY